MIDRYLLDLQEFICHSSAEQAAGASVIGGLEMGVACEPEENKFFTRQHRAPNGCIFIRCGVSEEYSGKAEARIGPDGTVLEILSLCVNGERARYRWWAAYIEEP